MSGATPTITITSDGTEIELKDQNVLYIDIRKKVNKVPSATIVLMEGGHAPDAWFALGDGDNFKPGAEIEIKLRIEGNTGDAGSDQSVFKGIIIKHGVQAREGSFFLRLDMKDKAFKLTTTRKSKVFDAEKTDKDIVEELIGEAGVTVGDVTEMDLTHSAEMVQYYCSNWDFIMSRAEANGCWVITDAGEMKIGCPTVMAAEAETHTFENIDMFYSLELEADIGSQVKAVKSVSWDIATQALFAAQEATAATPGMGDLVADDGATAVGADEDNLVNATDIPETEIKAWADAKMKKTRMAMLKGRISLPGSPLVKLGEVIKISGVGTRFDGNGVVTGARHYVDAQGWKTDVQVGGDPEWYYERRDIMDAPAAGLVPGVNGLQIGVVDAFEEDSLSRNRVRVKMPSVNETDVVWARIASIDSGPERGFFFRPEEGDEVILGFLGDDPRQPVILGAMHNDINVAPVAAEDITEDNYVKGVYTKEKLKIEFNDETKEIVIATPAENAITITDDTEEDKAGIIWSDQHGNVIKTDVNGFGIENSTGEKLAIEPEVSVTIEDSKGNKAVLEGDNGITVEDKDGNKITSNSDGITLDSTVDVIVKGTNITLEGSGDVTIEAGGNMTLTGSAVEIN